MTFSICTRKTVVQLSCVTYYLMMMFSDFTTKLSIISFYRCWNTMKSLSRSVQMGRNSLRYVFGKRTINFKVWEWISFEFCNHLNKSVHRNTPEMIQSHALFTEVRQNNADSQALVTPAWSIYTEIQKQGIWNYSLTL